MPVDTEDARSSLVSTYGDQYERHSHEYDAGLIVMPAASRTPAHRVIRTHGGMSTRRVNFNLSRQGRPPMIPRAEDTATETLLTAVAEPVRPMATGQSGNLIFGVRGEYLFVSSAPRVPGVNALPTGAYPHPVEPVGTIANAMFGQFLAQQAPPFTVADYDALCSALVAVAEARGGSNGTLTYVWPLTCYPAEFSLPTIEG